MDKELSEELIKAAKEKLPAINLTAQDMCRVTIATLATLASFMNKQTNFNRAKLFEFASKSVDDFLEEGS